MSDDIVIPIPDAATASWIARVFDVPLMHVDHSAWLLHLFPSDMFFESDEIQWILRDLKVRGFLGTHIETHVRGVVRILPQR